MKIEHLFRGGVKLDTLPLSKVKQNKFNNKITKFQLSLYKKCKMIVWIALVAFLVNQVPVSADVTDNLTSVVQRILGVRNDNVTDTYETASTNAKLNYMEQQVVSLQKSVEDLNGQNAAYSLYCYIQSKDTRYEGCELTLTSASGNQVAVGNLHLDERLNKYVTNIYSNFNGNCTLQYGSVKESIDLQATGQEHELKPYISDLTVWIDSNNSAYSGKNVVLKDSRGGTVESAKLKLVNGHYEATMTAYANGTYSITYPYVASSKVLTLTTGVTLNGSAKKQQLFGDLQQMSIADIQACCKAGAITNIAKVGDTFSDGTYTYTIIGINQDKPSDANGTALSRDKYGDVLTVMPLGAPKGAGNGSAVTTDASKTPWGTNRAQMNSSNTNDGSWKATAMRSSTMASYLAKLPANTQKAIGYVQKITGQCNSNSNTNITTGDKCFLLSGKEIFGDTGNGNGSYCTTAEAGATFQYQYFANIATSSASRTITGALSNWWWLRSPYYFSSGNFCAVSMGSSYSGIASNSFGVFAAFCIY